MKTVSVIIPVYNTEEYLEQSIQSVLDQSYDNLEIIIIDDNSSDDSNEIIQKFTKIDKRIKAIRFKTRKGVGAARNYGMNVAQGEYIYFLDSDDYLPGNTIYFLVNNIKDSKLIRGRMRNTRLGSSFAVVFNGLFNTKKFTENRYDLIKNNSACNFLFKTSFIEEHNVCFSEDNMIYADLYFMMKVLENVKSIPYLNEALYFRRTRNDPISNPSLRQYDIKSKITSFLSAYNYLKDAYNNKSAQKYLDEQLLNIYRKEIVQYFYDSSTIKELFWDLKIAVEKISPKILSTYDWPLRREVKVIRQGNKNKYIRLTKRYNFLRDLKEGLQSRRHLYTFLYKRVFSKLPIKKNLVFFESFLGKSYSDNPKYIYEYMSNNEKGYKYVWCFRDKKEIPGKNIQVKRFSLRYFYYLSRAKYWISNSRLPKYLNKREENIYLQTWHGTPLKTLVFDIKDIYSADPNYKQNFYEQSRRWDYLNSPNEYSTDIFRRAFKYDKTMLEFGYPRNDILYNKNNEHYINELKKKMNIPDDKKVILYAPTWRDDQFYSRGNYKFTLNMDLSKMQDHLSDDYVLVLRTHYHIANRIDVTKYKDFVFDLSAYDDIAELYLISDILITDYSSVFFDYANLKRPILFYTYDLENYRDTLRGLYFDIEEEVPGPILMTTSDVVNAVENIDSVKERYKEKYNEFYNKFCEWDDGNASEKTFKAVFKNND